MVSIRFGWPANRGDADSPVGRSQSDELKHYSSLPLVLGTAAAILLSTALGWFLLTREAPSAIDAGVEPVADTTSTSTATSAAGSLVDDDSDSAPALSPAEALADEAASPPETIEQSPIAATIDVDSELRKARLAANADMLVSPEAQNAFYFYSRVTTAEPDNVVAAGEFDAVLARIALIASDHLSRRNFVAAHDLADLVARHKPDHALVQVVNTALSDRAAGLVELAVGFARDGNADSLATTLTSIEALPGLGEQFLSNARSRISNEQQLRLNAERDRTEAERLLADEALAVWTGKVRGAIKSGRLVSPAGDNARDFLAERDDPKETKDVLTDELLDALLLAGQQSIDSGEVTGAENYFAAIQELNANAPGLIDFRNTLEQKLIAAEEAKIMGLSDFVRLNTTPARYPRLANQLNITGWVDVLFTVTPTGSTAEIEIIQAEPEKIFDESAVTAVEQWTFQPREYRGQLINQRASARLVYRLE